MSISKKIGVLLILLLLVNICEFKELNISNTTISAHDKAKLSYNEYCIGFVTKSNDIHNVELYILNELEDICLNETICDIGYDKCCKEKNFFNVEIYNPNDYDIYVEYNMNYCDEYESYISDRYDSYVVRYFLLIFIPVVVILFFILSCSLWKVCDKKRDDYNIVFNQV